MTDEQRCDHWWTDEEGGQNRCDGPVAIGNYCTMHAELLVPKSIYDTITDLRKDKARADWEEEHPHPVGYSWGGEEWFLMEGDDHRRFKTRREAIDAAIEAHKSAAEDHPNDEAAFRNGKKTIDETEFKL